MIRVSLTDVVSFWSGLTRGEKIVFPVALFYLAFVLATSTGGEQPSGEVVLFLVVIVVWTVRRGMRNAPN